jgi:hypothetical protein
MKTPDAVRKLNISDSDSQSKAPMFLEKREVLFWRPETPAETASRIRIAEADAENERTKSLIKLRAAVWAGAGIILVSLAVLMFSSSAIKQTSVAFILAAFLAKALDGLLGRNR